MIDLCCDDDLVPYYEKIGLIKSNGMLARNYSMQSGNLNKMLLVKRVLKRRMPSECWSVY